MIEALIVIKKVNKEKCQENIAHSMENRTFAFDLLIETIHIMNIKSFTLNQASLAALTNIIDNDSSILVVRPESHLTRLFTAAIRCQLIDKGTPSLQYSEICSYFASLFDDPAAEPIYRTEVASIANYLEQGKLYQVVYDSLYDYVMARCAALCAQLVAFSIPTEAEFVDGADLLVCHEENKLTVVDWNETAKRIKQRFNIATSTIVVSGGYGRTLSGYNVAIGKGGAQLVATSIAAELKAKEVTVYSESDGIQGIPSMTYTEATQFCSVAGSPLEPSALWPVLKANIPLRVVNVRMPKSHGTLISAHSEGRGNITGVVSESGLDLITVAGTSLLGTVGISSALFGALAHAGINIRFISQSSSEYSISILIRHDDAITALDAIRALMSENHLLTYDDVVYHEPGVSVIMVCGDRMQNVPGVSATIYDALRQASISVIASAQGGEQLSISIIVSDNDAQRAVDAIKKAVE